MKTLTTLAIILILAVLVFDRKMPTKRQTAKVTSTVQVATATPPPVLNPAKPLPLAIASLAKQKGIPEQTIRARFGELLESLPHYHFNARIIQHLDDGHLLIENLGWYPDEGFPRAVNYAVANYPQFNFTIDREIIQFVGVFVGPYRYLTTDGGNRTINEVFYVGFDPTDAKRFSPE